MEEFKKSKEAATRSLNLAGTLQKLFRPVLIKGMEGEKTEDPIARVIAEAGPKNLSDIESYLTAQSIDALAPLEHGYGFSAVVLDAGDRVVRLSRLKPTHKPGIPLVLQPLAEEIVGKISVQIFKKLQTAGITDADVQNVKDQLGMEGYRWDDAGTDNLGRDENGQLFILDGSVHTLA
ncbi:MAG TPA: hypothetical protein VHD55_02450 [Candidatus Paceibacterota bacterium]|nr:hypothetical protein [Candidatus Paceibacterota bacterium]